MKKYLSICLLCALIFAPMLTFAGKPKSFQKMQKAEWQMIQLRSGVEYNHAWNTVFDILINDFDLAMAAKEDGYIRTEWLHSYGGGYEPDYRLRVTVRFSEDKQSLRIKPEAQLKDGESWITGVDSRLLSTLKTDLMGTVGRTTR